MSAVLGSGGHAPGAGEFGTPANFSSESYFSGGAFAGTALQYSTVAPSATRTASVPWGAFTSANESGPFALTLSLPPPTVICTVVPTVPFGVR